MKSVQLIIFLGIFFLLAGAGFIFTGVGIVGTFFLWWVAYGLLIG